jgi:aminomethyltransferase
MEQVLPTPTALQTPLHEKHVAFSAKLSPFAGYWMPIRYRGDVAEHLHVREHVGVFDVSHMGEFLVRGPQALPFLQFITSNDVSKLAIGKAQYSTLPNDTGGIVDDLIVYRLESELYLTVVNAANIEKDWAWFISKNSFGAELTNISADTALIAVSGPMAIDTLVPLTDLPVALMGNYQCLKGTVAGIPDVLVATTGYTGERTYELMVRNERAAELWDAVFESGAEFDIQPIGLGARDTLRLEMGYMLYGNDINDETSPIAAGLSWVTKLDKGEFNAQPILQQHKSSGTARKLVAFEMLERGIPRQHYAVAVDGQVVGEVTSGTFSPSLQKGIGMAYIDAPLAALGQEVDVVIRNVPIKSKVVKAPFVSDTSVTQWYKK